MKIKNILLLAVAFLVVFTACQDDEYEMPNDMAGIGWYTSAFRNEQIMIGINDFVSFSDVSQNAVSHTWTIPEGSFLLEGPISRTDSVLEDFIIPDAGLETTDLTIHVLFTKGGLQPVRLYNTFDKKVTFFGRDTLEAKKEGDLWVIDTTFMVDVFDTIVPSVLIRQEGVEVPVNEDTIYVEAGGTLEFVDVSTVGRANSWEWRVAGEMSTDSAATIVFKKLGVFEATLNISRQGESLPGDYQFYRIPNPIKVIPSSKPWELAGDIVELEDETIQLPFNGEFLPFMNKNDFFVVKVNGEAFPISSVTIDANDATLLNIKLVDPIYRPDVITVSILDGSGINSSDYRSLTPFEDEPVMMHDVNLLSATGYGFEDGGSAWSPSWDNASTIEFTTEKAASGNYSMKITREGAKAKVESFNEKFSFTGGKVYTIKYKIFIESTAGGAYGVWLIPNWKQFWQSLDNKPTGEWVTVETEWAPSADEPDRHFLVQMNGDGVFYFDDFYIVEKEVRP
ncbi:hypothetical protein [uncultured Draconibacterium sp.]|uniref:hypothetical protein n=1 Tax=uncultured Draconibacterium sp. TaxID=1573823 RepID=UPI0025D591B0|nr:hypothetical protein [uncultured Draconibacterium sp.]